MSDLKLIELDYQSDRAWASLLRERVATLVAVATEIFTAKDLAEVRDVGRNFSNAQAQVEILVSSEEHTHIELRAAIRELSLVLKSDDLKSDKTVRAVGEKRRRIVDLTRNLVEITCSRNYSQLHITSLDL